MKRILSISLLLLLSLLLAGCKDSEDDIDPIYDNVIFDTFGEDEITITEGIKYFDIGFIAKDSGVDIQEFVTVDNPVDTSVPGSYDITFTLDYHDKITVLTRTVIVLYRNAGCSVVDDTELIECYQNWSSYLHTAVTLKIYFNNNEFINASDVFDEVENILALYHQISDKYDTYEGYVNVKTINDNPTDTHVILPELFELISFTIEKQDDVDDLFNLALGPVLQIWHDYREDCLLNSVCAVPEMNDLVDASLFTNPDDIIMNSENYSITMGEGMSIDLGGVSKGFISGKIIEYLDSINLSGYLLNNGESNISIGGTHPTREGGKFILAITDPTFNLPYYATVYLEDGDQLVTSGDYQQYYMVGDDLYHHIIHNDTLMPERNSRSVSIIYSDPAISDLYSTAIFLMPIEEGIEFIDGIDGLEGIWYGMDGTIHFSQNFEELYLQDTFE